ncbi:MAG: AAA family ATPase [Bacilli bacterium]
MRGYNDTYEVEFGEYPQYAASSWMQNTLNSEYNRGSLKTTGKTYTFDSVRFDDYDKKMEPVTYNEYEYNGEKYIRLMANSGNGSTDLSNGIKYNDGDYVWIKIEPVKWLIDEKQGLLLSKKGILSGIRYHTKDTRYDGDFSKTEMKAYLDNYLSKDLFNNFVLDNTISSVENGRKSRIEKLNPDTTDISDRRAMTYTEIIHNWIESGQSVLLRGPSGIGKTERLKTLYPNLIYIKLTNNMFPEKVVGSMNLQTGQSIPPDFYKQALMSCATEEEKKLVKENVQNIYDLVDTIYERSKNSSEKVVILLDELLNVKPAVQSLVYTLVLNRLVEIGNGLKLPANTVIVATGNQKKYSSVAEDLAEPLEKRFDHILDMEPKVGEWINDYAIPNKVHPSVIGYIFSKYNQKGKSESISDMNYFYEEPEVGDLHTDCNGCRGRTNDPRGWVSISNTLYSFEKDLAEGKFIGKDVENLLQVSLSSKLRDEWAREFFDFYNIPTISVDEVVNKNYTQADLPRNINERFACVTSLLLADLDQVQYCRDFIRENCDPEYLQLYDICWCGNDERRMEKIVELQECTTLSDDINMSSEGVGIRI